MKRFSDIFLASIAILILGIPLAFLALGIRFKLGSPVFFSQIRAGKDGRPFVMKKFRTMTEERDANGNLLPDSERLTPFGKLLRSTSLDELPELWNVLKGEMSLVGPRPLLMDYLPLYSPQQMRRHLVRPGITGWAQINGRNSLGWEEKFALDTWYVDNQSLFLDIRILWLTVKKVLIREGISADGEATMVRFKGNKDQSGKELK